MGVKKYEFCAEEMILIREALAEYKFILRVGQNSSENRKKNFAMVKALHEQFVSDVRLLKL